MVEVQCESLTCLPTAWNNNTLHPTKSQSLCCHCHQQVSAYVLTSVLLSRLAADCEAELGDQKAGDQVSERGKFGHNSQSNSHASNNCAAIGMTAFSGEAPETAPDKAVIAVAALSFDVCESLCALQLLHAICFFANSAPSLCFVLVVCNCITIA